MNLLQETLDCLHRESKSVRDVRWVGRRSNSAICSWYEFAEQARYIEYDNGYGIPEVPEDLVVVGDDWWMERAEYDGAEWWEFKKNPNKWVGNTTDLELKIK